MRADYRIIRRDPRRAGAFGFSLSGCQSTRSVIRLPPVRIAASKSITESFTIPAYARRGPVEHVTSILSVARLNFHTLIEATIAAVA
jgi:hypothetical protein